MALSMEQHSKTMCLHDLTDMRQIVPKYDHQLQEKMPTVILACGPGTVG